MPEREKVIRGLAACGVIGGCHVCPYNGGEDCSMDVMMRDALELLKAQELPVRCAECKYYGRGGNPDGFGWCGRPGAGCSLPEDYYCKYGTKKEGEDVEVH